MEEKEDKWVYLNLPLFGSDAGKIEKELKSEMARLSLKNPSNYPPIVDSKIEKKIGFNLNSLLKLNLNSDEAYVIRSIQNSLKSYSLNEIKSTSFIEDRICGKYYSSIRSCYSKYSHNRNLVEKVNQYLKEYCEHEKIINYYENKKKFNDLKREIVNKYTFEKTKYNSQGYLLTLEDKKTNKVFGFLIGTKQSIRNSFRFERSKNIEVVRAKKVLSDEEIHSLDIFN